jgi:integrase
MSRGHIRARGTSGRCWELKFDALSEGGGRRTVYRSFKGTKREAQPELTRQIAQAASTGFTEPAKLTVAEFVRSRFEHWKESGIISPLTAQRYEQLIEWHVVPHLGARLLQKLGTRDVEWWHAVLLKRGRKGRYGQPDGESGLAARTVAHVHKVLTRALNDAVKHGLLLRNVCSVQRAPKVVAKEMKILTPEQVAEFVTILGDHPLAAAAIVALFTGMRRGELLALRWSNVDLDDEVIKVRESLEQTKGGGLRFKPPKSRAGIRDLRLPAIVTDTLVAQRKRLLEQRLLLGLGKLTDKDLVFPAWDGTPQWPNVFGTAWSRLAAARGLAVSFHELRHTHASQLIDAGVDVVTISKRLGHSSAAITLQVYAHLFRKDDSKAAAAINAALGG